MRISGFPSRPLGLLAICLGLTSALLCGSCTRSADTTAVAPSQPSGVNAGSIHPNAVVATDGSGNYRTVQNAVDAAPSDQTSRFVIRIKPGIYRAKVVIPATKGPITFVGDEPETTVLTYNEIYPDNPNEAKLFSPSTVVLADNFQAENITFENSAAPFAKALAINVSADKAVFRHCRFLGWQDTLRANRGRQYYEDCYIAGHVDFIFGAATAWFERCELHCRDGGAITASSAPKEQPYGFVFSHCKITADRRPRGSVRHDTLLGRPWRPFASVIFLNTEMDRLVARGGWGNWDDPNREKTVRFAEYHSTGRGGKARARVPYSKQLTDSEAAAVTVQKVFGGWDPKVTPAKVRPPWWRRLFGRDH